MPAEKWKVGPKYVLTPVRKCTSFRKLVQAKMENQEDR